VRRQVQPSGYRLTGEGRLVRLMPPRHLTVNATAISQLDSGTLRGYLRIVRPGSYTDAAIREELDRRTPRSASLYYGPEKGWEPLYA
jgi:hypothetical protein